MRMSRWDRCGEASGEVVQQWCSRWKVCPVRRVSHKVWPLSPPCATRNTWSTAVPGVTVPGQERGNKESKWDPGRLRVRQILVCDCHAQCMSHERCAPRSWQDKNHPWYYPWKSFPSAFPDDGLCKDLVLPSTHPVVSHHVPDTSKVLVKILQDNL